MAGSEKFEFVSIGEYIFDGAKGDGKVIFKPFNSKEIVYELGELDKIFIETKILDSRDLDGIDAILNEEVSVLLDRFNENKGVELHKFVVKRESFKYDPQEIIPGLMKSQKYPRDLVYLLRSGDSNKNREVDNITKLVRD
jgi:hypothetical protein